MKGRILDACRTHGSASRIANFGIPDQRGHFVPDSYKALHLNHTDDSLGAYVYKMVERVQNGKTRYNDGGDFGLGIHYKYYISDEILETAHAQ